MIVKKGCGKQDLSLKHENKILTLIYKVKTFFYKFLTVIQQDNENIEI